ncbi:MAG: Yip1 family protein [Allosphingosinicella sp.]
MATNPAGTSLVERVKNVLVQPAAEWRAIEAEPATIRGIYTSYVCILAAIPPIASLIGMVLFGWAAAVFSGGMIANVVLHYLGSLAIVYLLALIIDALAPTFGGTKDMVRAFKVAAYSMTPFWIGGLLLIVPTLGMIVWLIGLYGIYLMYLGLPILMKPPEDKATPYVAVSAVAMLVLVGLVYAIIQRILIAIMMSPGMVPVAYST